MAFSFFPHGAGGGWGGIPDKSYVSLNKSLYLSDFLICKLRTIFCLSAKAVSGINEVKYIQNVFVKFKTQFLNKETDG